ncbi:hypothetical protein AJ80_02326 [Polytolypa hystricis UAMH7299]|uniref:Uncharacterized protein n=1 Tax=Polytolypa hystricis (strain UAMH7299) TaxID=1447883 RepID=A0A2B7YPG2_POLH7|nr:hypothetical protein AJ80_02326 [Polytolypa hystricis UAMH7299]
MPRGNNKPLFHRIGAGLCGSVWTPTSSNDRQFMCAFKRADGIPGRSLPNDYEMRGRVLDALKQLVKGTDKENNDTVMAGLHIQVPHRYNFIKGDDETLNW